MSSEAYVVLFRRAWALGPRAVAASLFRKIGRAIANTRRRQADSSRTTYAAALPFSEPTLYSYFGAVPLSELDRRSERIAALAEHWLSHRFDLLGSGWVRVTHGMRCRGLQEHRFESGPPVDPDREGRWLEGRILTSNVAESRRVWSLVREEYIPIDWQLDFKSGYRWSERTWYRDVQYGCQPGADIKVPWELARMQHLPQLALAYAIATRSTTPALQAPEVYAAEFRNEVLDFVATNPPRWGVNWASTMDVAIRVANWLVAHDLFAAHGAQFDPEFESLFRRSVYEHGEHIVTNLEWTPSHRGNHYLANIVGLLFVAAYLPACPKTSAWLAFAVQELVNEVGHQFTPDGANFESSTCYHCLGLEMTTYATAMVIGLTPEKEEALRHYDHRLHQGRPPLHAAPLFSYPAPDGRIFLPQWYFERLERMGKFALHVTKPSGHLSQIGDNDSGRFLKLNAAYVRRTTSEAKARYENLAGYTELPDGAPYWDEEHLDYRDLSAMMSEMMSELFDHHRDRPELASEGAYGAHLVRSLMRGRRLPSDLKPGSRTAAEQMRIGSPTAIDTVAREFEQARPDQRQAIDFPAPGSDLRQELRTIAYPDFGLFIFRSPRLYLTIRCGPGAQDGVGAHCHNDQLSIEMSLDRRDLMCDPGTYLYTPLPRHRNAYRSARAHFGPQLDDAEPGRLDLGLFRLRPEGRAECLYFGPRGFAGVWRARRRAIHGLVQLDADSVRVRFVASGCRLARTEADMHPQIRFSPGYGKLLAPQAGS